MAGFSLAVLSFLVTKWVKKEFFKKNYDLIVIFISGYVVSLPMMFRDYLFMDHIFKEELERNRREEQEKWCKCQYFKV
jgi:hypothetical protein